MVSCSGDIQIRDKSDLRLLLRISGHDAISQIARILPDCAMSDFERLMAPYRASILSAEESRCDWRRYPIEYTVRPRFISMAQEALQLAYDSLSGFINTDGIDVMESTRDLFWDAEWAGVQVDLGASGLTHNFVSRISQHMYGDRIHVQIDAIPREKTSRLGVRGGYNVMSWPRECRHALRAAKGHYIFSIDFVAMDTRSISALSPKFGELIKGHSDPYVALPRSLGCATVTQDARRLIKACFLPMAYGAADDALQVSAGVSPEAAAKLRKFLRPALDMLPIGPEFARIVQETSSMVFRSALHSMNQCISGLDMYTALFPVHDEVVFTGPAENLDGAALLAEAMAEAASEAGGVEYTTRLKYGPNLGELSEI